MIKFIHLRYINPFNDNVETKGGFTVAYVEHANDTVTYAIAKCSKKDNYCKRIGRDVATGRMKAGQCMTTSLNKEKPYEVIKLILQNMERHGL